MLDRIAGWMALLGWIAGVATAIVRRWDTVRGVSMTANWLEQVLFGMAGLASVVWLMLYGQKREDRKRSIRDAAIHLARTGPGGTGTPGKRANKWLLFLEEASGLNTGPRFKEDPTYIPNPGD